MAEYFNAKCCICGQKYHICNSCANQKRTLSWRKIACSPNCYQIFLALSARTNGYETPEGTRFSLQKCDLTGLSSFEDNIRTSIQHILETEPDL